MELEDIMLSEVSQVQKEKGHMFSLISGSYIKIQIQALSYIHSLYYCILIKNHFFKKRRNQEMKINMAKT
jgi:hypothetical protein